MFTRTTAFIFLAMIVATGSSGQARKAVYIEVGGHGIFASVNYDSRFTKKENGFGYRVGLGIVPGFEGAPGTTSTLLTIPFGINHLTGKKSHHFESGLCATYISGKVKIYGLEKENARSIVLIPSFGYRYALQGGGFLGRGIVLPIVRDGKITLFYGFGAGFTF